MCVLEPYYSSTHYISNYMILYDLANFPQDDFKILKENQLALDSGLLSEAE